MITDATPIGEIENFVKSIIKDTDKGDKELRRYFASCDLPPEVVDYCLSLRKQKRSRVKCFYDKSGRLGKVLIKGKGRA